MILGKRKKRMSIDDALRQIVNREIPSQISDKSQAIAEILERGNSAEIKRNTDGTIKVYEVIKKKA